MTSTSDATVETSEEDLAALLDDAGVTDDTIESNVSQKDDTLNDTDEELMEKPTRVWTNKGALRRSNIGPPESNSCRFHNPAGHHQPLFRERGSDERHDEMVWGHPNPQLPIRSANPTLTVTLTFTLALT